MSRKKKTAPRSIKYTAGPWVTLIDTEGRVTPEGHVALGSNFVRTYDPKQHLTRYGQTITSQRTNMFGFPEITSVSLADWSVPPSSILNPNRLFASKRLLVEED